MSAKMQVVLKAPRAFALPNLIQGSVRSKITKAELMKRLHKDNKILFGELHETKKEKIAREKRERKLRANEKPAVDLSPKKLQTDSEIYHVMNSKGPGYSRLKFTPKFEPHQTKTILKLSDLENSKDGTEKIPREIHSPSKMKPDKTEPVKSAANVSKNLGSPSGLVISKMTSFSYLDGKRNAPDNFEGGEIVSVSPYADRTKLSIPSVTRILNQTMSPQAKLNLELWKQRMIVELGEEGFEKYSQELLSNGKQFHSSVQNFLTDKPFQVPSSVEKSWASVQHVLKDVSHVRAIESHVVHSKLYYRGIVDCVAMFKGNLCVIDWKKSDKPKDSIENTYDAPIQVASYIGALNSDSNYKFQVRNGLVVVGYTNGDPASVHQINPTLLNKYWKLWLRRLQQYYLGPTSVNQAPITDAEK